MVRSLDKLLQDGAMLGDLFSSVCGGDQSEWYDLVALRTEAGAARQIIHSDTPFQKVPDSTARLLLCKTFGTAWARLSSYRAHI